MYIQLDVGWLHHPFPVSRFRIASQSQLDTLRSLGLLTIRYFPDKSDPQLVTAPTGVPAGGLPELMDSVPDLLQEQEAQAVSQGFSPQLAEQHAVLKICNTRFQEAADGYRHLSETCEVQPETSLAYCDALIAGYIQEIMATPETVIRLLSEGVGEQQAAHPVNVTVLALLLGKALGMPSEQLQHLGVAAMLHDIGKQQLPPDAREARPHMTAEQREAYEGHVGASVAVAQRMGVAVDVLTAIAQHHETVDGEGFPLRLIAEDISPAGQILALVNTYDRLCNPAQDVAAHTPHEALSILFAQRRHQYDLETIKAFVRIMGVYPPGSVVQLSDQRYGLVVSVNAARPLKPRLIAYDARVPKQEALILDLEDRPDLAISRSLRPAQLSREMLDYLSPRERICYFFERAVDLSLQKAAA